MVTSADPAKPRANLEGIELMCGLAACRTYRKRDPKSSVNHDHVRSRTYPSLGASDRSFRPALVVMMAGAADTSQSCQSRATILGQMENDNKITSKYLRCDGAVLEYSIIDLIGCPKPPIGVGKEISELKFTTLGR